MIVKVNAVKYCIEISSSVLLYYILKFYGEGTYKDQFSFNVLNMYGVYNNTAERLCRFCTEDVIENLVYENMSLVNSDNYFLYIYGQ